MSTLQTLRFDTCWTTPPINLNDRGHWATRARKRIGLHAQAMTQRLQRNGHEIPYVLWQMNAANAPKRSKKAIQKPRQGRVESSERRILEGGRPANATTLLQG